MSGFQAGFKFVGFAASELAIEALPFAVKPRYPLYLFGQRSCFLAVADDGGAKGFYALGLAVEISIDWT